MTPHSHVAAPSIDQGVLGRLRRLDPQLRITWSPWAIDHLNGQPVEHRGCAVRDPSFHLWRKDELSSHHHYVMPLPRVTHLEVAKLERDVARTMRPQDIVPTHLRRLAERREAGLRAQRDGQEQKIRANRRRIGDLLEGKLGRRQAKIVSAPGLSRGTPGEVPVDSREDGWELPREEA